MKGRRFLHRFLALVRLACALGILASVNILAARWSRSDEFGRLPWRVDLTERRQFTFHPQSLEILRGLDDIVAVTFYNTGGWPLDLQTQQERVRDLMGEIVRESRGKVVFEEIDPFKGAQGDNERMLEIMRAVEGSGIRGRLYASADPLKSSQQGYFSLRVEHLGKQEIIDAPETAINLEYRVMAAIQKLSRERKVVGVISPSPKSPLEVEFPRFVREIGEYATPRRCVPVNNQSFRVSPAMDSLVVIGPRALDLDSLASIDAHVMAGKPALFVLDGMVPMTHTAFAPNSLKLIDMLESYGVKVVKAMAFETAPELALQELARVGPGRATPVTNYYKFIAGRNNFDRESPLVAAVSDAEFYYATPLEPAAKVPEGVKVRPLVWTSALGGRDASDKSRPLIEPFPDPRRSFSEDELSTQTLVMEARGTFPAYRAEVRPEDRIDVEAGRQGDGSGQKLLGLDPGEDARAPEGTRLVVVGGSYLLRNEANASGYALLHNILEQLTYDSSLSELRAQRHVSRTLRRDLDEEGKKTARLMGLLAPPTAVLLAGLAFALFRGASRRRRAALVLAAGAPPKES